MKKDIYKIINKINGKIYIGQSVNAKHRFKEHIYGTTNHVSIIHNAISKYGADNFEMEIIEEQIENFDEREIYWIKFYNSTDRNFGYNIQLGGRHASTHKGEKAGNAKYSNETILNIQNDLILNVDTFEEIAIKYNVRVEYIWSINQGTVRKNDNFSYPLRINGNERLSKDKVMLIINRLIYTNESVEQIAKEMQITSKPIYLINKGRHYWCPDNIEYPIRDKMKGYSKILLGAIISELKSNNYKFSQIEKMYNIPHVTLSRINVGKIYKQKDINYPIRKSFQRVYNPVETIPG